MYGRTEAGDSWSEYLKGTCAHRRHVGWALTDLVHRVDLDTDGPLFDGLGGVTPGASSIFGDAFAAATDGGVIGNGSFASLASTNVSFGSGTECGAIGMGADDRSMLDGFDQSPVTISPAALLAQNGSGGQPGASALLFPTADRQDDAATLKNKTTLTTTTASTSTPTPTLTSTVNTTNATPTTNRYPQQAAATPRRAAGALQFMPQGDGSLRPATTSSPSVSQDSPLAGTLSETSTRSGSEHPRRDAHMASEQRRRAMMRQSFERLQQLLPGDEYRKPSKANLLQASVNHITRLQHQEMQLKNRILHLQREISLLRQQIHGTSPAFADPSAAGTGTASRSDGASGKMPPIAPAIPQPHPHQL